MKETTSSGGFFFLSLAAAFSACFASLFCCFWRASFSSCLCCNVFDIQLATLISLNWLLKVSYLCRWLFDFLLKLRCFFGALLGLLLLFPKYRTSDLEPNTYQPYQSSESYFFAQHTTKQRVKQQESISSKMTSPIVYMHQSNNSPVQNLSQSDLVRCAGEVFQSYYQEFWVALSDPSTVLLLLLQSKTEQENRG